jgi:hypothetical protein
MSTKNFKFDREEANVRDTAKGGTLTIDKFLEMKQEEKELEFQNDKRLFP